MPHTTGPGPDSYALSLIARCGPFSGELRSLYARRVVLSGPGVQRGQPALISSLHRELALLGHPHLRWCCDVNDGRRGGQRPSPLS